MFISYHQTKNCQANKIVISVHCIPEAGEGAEQTVITNSEFALSVCSSLYQGGDIEVSPTGKMKCLRGLPNQIVK